MVMIVKGVCVAIVDNSQTLEFNSLMPNMLVCICSKSLFESGFDFGVFQFHKRKNNAV